MADKKKYLRAILKRTRDSIAPSRAVVLSARVQSLLLGADCYRQSLPVVLYSSLAKEVSTEAILDDALGSRRAVFYPRLESTSGNLSLHRVGSRSDLAPGAYGILEPLTPSIEPASMPPCVVLVPGVAFSARGERIGRGGGHYDRLLAELSPQAITVGLAYSFQLLDQVPQAEWDRRLNFVVTESAVYPAPDANFWDGGYRSQGGIPR